MYSEMFKLHADLLKALSHPKRLEIIHLLRDQELTVTQIQQMLDLPQANLSQHLMILRQNQVVEGKKQGREINYSLAHQNFVKASDLIRSVLALRYQNGPLASELTKKMIDLMPVTHDPVCDMRVSPKTAAAAIKHKNKDYYFCASGCQKKFIKNPQKYLKE